jgi:hypothetical protein
MNVSHLYCLDNYIINSSILLGLNPIIILKIHHQIYHEMLLSVAWLFFCSKFLGGLCLR